MPGLTQPLDFRRHLRRPPAGGLDPVPFLDLLLVGLFLALNFSAFVIAPGSRIDLPRSESEGFLVSSSTAVLTVDRNQLFFFQGAKLSEAGLPGHFRRYLEDLPEEASAPSLLVKADTSIEAGVLFRLMDLARQAGFTKIHLAAESSPRTSLETMTLPGVAQEP
jgi:biopolymer transport protein ExbD